MTFEHFWQWISFLIWFKLVWIQQTYVIIFKITDIISLHQRIHKKSWKRAQETKTTDSKGREGPFVAWRKGRGAPEMWAPARAAQLPECLQAKPQGHPAETWRCLQSLWRAFLEPGGGFTQLNPHFQEASYLQDRWCLIEQQIHWIK